MIKSQSKPNCDDLEISLAKKEECKKPNFYISEKKDQIQSLLALFKLDKLDPKLRYQVPLKPWWRLFGSKRSS